MRRVARDFVIWGSGWKLLDVIVPICDCLSDGLGLKKDKPRDSLVVNKKTWFPTSFVNKLTLQGNIMLTTKAS